MIWLNCRLHMGLSPLQAAQHDYSLCTLAISPLRRHPWLHSRLLLLLHFRVVLFLWFLQWTSMPSWPHAGSMDFTFTLYHASTLSLKSQRCIVVLSLIRIGGLPCRKNMMLSWLITAGMSVFPTSSLLIVRSSATRHSKSKKYDRKCSLPTTTDTHTPTAFHFPCTEQS